MPVNDMGPWPMGEFRMPPAELQKNIEAFEVMRETLEEHHMRKYVVFHDGKFAGAFDTFHNAARDAVRRFRAGPYLIRQVGGRRSMPMPASIAYRPHHAAD